MAEEAYVFPLSFAQQRLWFLDQLEPESSVYSIPQAFRISGDLNVDIMQKAFEAIVARHESLRTTISSVEGTPMQLIAENGTVVIPVIDLKSLPGAEREAEAKRLAAEEFRKPFNLAQGPLLRVSLLRLGDKQHILLLNMSHIISDGWSMEILVQEMTKLYEAYATGNHPSLPELPVQYADFAHWQREWLQGEALESQISYWKKQLGGNLPVLELPVDHPRPVIQTYPGKRINVELGKDVSEALKTLSQQEGVTLFMTLLAVFQTLLHRYTGHDDIIVGSPIANRNRLEIEGIIGFFVNTLVLRSDLSGNHTFRELVSRVRQIALGAYAHQDLPFEKLVEELQVERNLSYNPLFQVMFVLQNTPMQPVQLPGLTLTPLDIEVDTAMFDLRVELSDKSDGITGIFEYNTDLFEASTIERMAGYFKTLLQGVVAGPQQRISELPLLTEAERHQILVEWNDTEVDYPQDKLIHQIFESQVERSPDSIAVVFEGEQLTYKEFNQRANQLARYLKSLGVGPETLVGIAAERSLEMVIGLYGILKAGGAYVPLDPSYPAERIAQMIEDAGVPVILTQAKLRDVLPPHQAQVICLDKDWDELIADKSDDNPPCEVTTDNLAYTIYTSGSTGKPKGVMNTHRGILNRLLWMQDAYRLTASDRVLQKTPFSFDVSVWEFFWPLMFGACLVVARPEGHRDSDYLVKTIIDQQITTIHFVPSMLQIFLMAKDVEKCDSLRQVICSGEALPLDLQSRFFARLNVKLHNLYGPTEAAVDVTYWECQRESELNTVPIGRPVANTRMHILDRYMQPVPIGVSGELCIGGVQVARGYLNRPELTTEKFIPDPFSDNSEARLYRTGDSARYMPDGNIEYLGRLDFQVKIRGNRIELGEIEAVLSQHPEVREVCVLAREDIPGDQRLVAYVIPDNNQKQLTGELRKYMQQKLPEFMIPSYFLTLETFPLTPNQKIDRKALPAPDRVIVRSEVSYTPPKNELQQTIANIWQELLNVPKVGVDDNFFELGGHSLLIVQVYYRLKELIDRELAITDMFRFPTINALTEYLSCDVDEDKQISVQESADRAKARKAAIMRRRQVKRSVK